MDLVRLATNCLTNCFTCKEDIISPVSGTLLLQNFDLITNHDRAPRSNFHENSFVSLLKCLIISNLFFLMCAQGAEPNERTHLLIDPVSNSPAVHGNHSNDFLNEYANSMPRRDEQTALNKIVQDTATYDNILHPHILFVYTRLLNSPFHLQEYNRCGRNGFA